MHVYVFEPREVRHVSLAVELRSAGIEAQFVDTQFFASMAATLQQPGFKDRAVLIGESELMREQVQTLRRAGCQNPILILRDFRNARDTSAMLDLGADDVLVSPIKGGEVFSRIKCIVRRLYGHAAHSVVVGELTAYFDGRDPVVSGHSVRLSKREHAIFQHLALNSNKITSKDAIYDAVYGMSADQPFDKVIDVYICKIRKKLADAAQSGFQYIETIRGRGYKLRPPESLDFQPGAAAESMDQSSVHA